MLARLLKVISRITLPRVVVIGLDIQDRHALGVLSSRHQGEVKVLFSEVFDLPEDAIQNGELKRPEVLRPIILKLAHAVPQGRWWKDNEPIFVLSIPPERLYTETFFLPSMSAEEFDTAIRLKLETSLPWPLREAYVDWTILPTGTTERTGVFVAAMAKPVLDQYFKIFLENGVRVGACEFHLFSLIRFVGTEEAKSFIFVLIDEDGFEFAMFAFGGILGHYVQPISNPQDNQRILEDKLKQLASYIEGSYGVTAERIFVFDKLSWENLSSQLEMATGVPTQIFTPTSTLIDPELSVAYGASLRPYSAAESLMNLLPEHVGGRYQENLLEKTLRFWAVNFVAIALVFLGVFFSVFLFLSNQEHALETHNAAARVKLDEKLSQQKDLLDEVAVFDALSTHVSGALASRTLVEKQLRFLDTEAKARGFLVRHIALHANKGTISFIAPTWLAAEAWKKELETRGLFGTVTLPDTSGEGTNIPLVMSFSLL